MSHFFLFYKDIQLPKFPLEIFHISHILLLLCSFAYITQMLKCYGSKSESEKHSFQIHIGIYFFIEELLYTIWVFFSCSKNPLLEVMPLQLCTICVYMNIASIYFKKDYLKLFSGLVGTLAGLIAVLYPANIAQLYPVFSYRVLNFYLLHSTFILFGLIQLKDTKILRYRYINSNMLVLSILSLCAFLFNIKFHTDYMFIGSPPQLSMIRSIYEFSGTLFFLPMVLLVLYVIQLAVLLLIKTAVYLMSYRKENN